MISIRCFFCYSQRTRVAKISSNINEIMFSELKSIKSSLEITKKNTLLA